MRHLLLVRLYSNRFLVDNEKETAERVIEELTEFDHAAEKMRDELTNSRRHELSFEVINLALKYEEIFEKTAEIIFERNNLIHGTLYVLGPKVAGEMEQIKLDIEKEQDELGPRATHAMEQSILIALIVAGIAIVLGTLLVFITGRAISRPIIGHPAKLVPAAQARDLNSLVARGNLGHDRDAEATVEVWALVSSAVLAMELALLCISVAAAETASTTSLTLDAKSSDDWTRAMSWMMLTTSPIFWAPSTVNGGDMPGLPLAWKRVKVPIALASK